MLSSRASRIAAEYARGDQRLWMVTCRGCQREGPIAWDAAHAARLLGDGDRPAFCVHVAEGAASQTAAIVCACGRRWSERDRLRAIEGGRWVPQAAESADPTYRSFYIWAGSSPYARLSEIVDEHAKAQEAASSGDFAKLRAWTQLKLGEAFDESIIGDRLPEIQQLRAALVARAGRDDGDPPMSAVVTAGLDVQGDRVEALSVIWGADEECWLGTAEQFDGDPADPADPCWVAAAAWLKAAKVQRGSIDARYSTDAVLQFAESAGIAATMGRSDGAGALVQRPKLPDPAKVGKRLIERAARLTVPVWPIGVSSAKRLVMSRLAKAEPAPGFVHIPAWFEASHARQIVSEREIEVTDRHGRVKRKWELINRRNELLDMFILATHAKRRKRG